MRWCLFIAIGYHIFGLTSLDDLGYHGLFQNLFGAFLEVGLGKS